MRRGGGSGGRVVLFTLWESDRHSVLVLLILFCLFIGFLCLHWKTPPTSYASDSLSFIAINHHRGSGSLNRRRPPPSLEEPDVIHVALPFDVGEYNLGLKALVGSIVNNTKNPQRLFFHLISEPKKALAATQFASELQLRLPQETQCDVSVFDHWEEVKHLYSSPSESLHLEGITSKSNTSYSTTGTRFGNPLNVARIYLEKLFPSIEKVVSLDTDQIVLGDIAELHEVDLSTLPIASTRSEKAQPLSFYLNLEHRILKELVESDRLDLTERVFGGGLFVANLTAWRREDYTSKIEDWCRVHLEQPLLAQKTLKKTLLNLVFNRRVHFLHDSWNSGDCNTPTSDLLLQTESGYENNNNRGEAAGSSRRIKVLHFAGFNGKPWDSLSVCSSLIKKLWNFYFSLFSKS
eukprot:TRINITY_DN6312_c0_g1_i2.p1 TRINITY_DN6312_c0_g1~~TRINITY_DN6312_c0_g1_i2.p1  ORF type:complete len:406 (+),score=50.35 TRINITY_DN6312_c0_g1_i2:64-1281(+)